MANYLICGPVGSGRQAFVRHVIRLGDRIINVGPASKGAPSRLLLQPERLASFVADLRDRLGANLSQDRLRDTWVIADAPDVASRRLVAERLGGAGVCVLEMPAEVCIRRLAVDPERAGDLQRWLGLLYQWWASYEPFEGEIVLTPGDLRVIERVR